MASVIGETLSHYKILDKLGAGGMGEVYLAEDTTLKRRVALKVLPPDLAASQERLERFQREAETLAALDHPNIVHIHTVEEADGVHFLTMQLVEGKPLSELISKGGMPLDRIFEIAIPLADALATAHEKGVIHRDLKPANIMVTDEWRVKVLDFGLAKLRQEDEVPLSTELPTEPLTEEGRILGTFPYMSPEQLEGKAADSRSDIFSLGVILYEMATGERPFHGDSSISLISSIVKDTPSDVDAIRSELPHHFSRIVRRSLEKDPKKRYQTMLDIHNELVDLRAESASGGPQKPRKASHRRAAQNRWVAWISVLGALVILAVAGLWVRTSLVSPARVSEKPLDLVYRQITFSGNASSPVLSPDGRYLAYITRTDDGNAVLVRDLESDSEVTVFTGWNISRVAWTPDSLHLAIPAIERHGPSPTAAMHVLPRFGGEPRSYTWKGPHISWSSSGDHFVTGYMPAARLFIHDRASQATEALELGDLHRGQADRYFLQTVQWSPRGSDMLVKTFGPRKDYFWLVDSATGSSVKIWEEDRGTAYYSSGSIPYGVASWSPSGESVLYLSNSSGLGELWELPHATSTESAIVPRRILADLQARTFSVSRESGMLSFEREDRRSQIWLLVRDDESTGFRTLAQVTSGTHFDHDPRVSPDGTRVAFVREQRVGQSNVFIASLESGAASQTTFIDGYVSHPCWSPDGSKIAFGVFETESQSDHGTIGVVDLQDQSRRVFFVELSGSGELTWQPGDSILYHQPGNRAFLGMDPDSGTRIDLSLDPDAGWMFSPIQSSDGERVLLFWNRPDSGLYIASDRGATTSLVTTDRWRPIAWDEDRKEILALQDRNDQLYVRFAVVDERSGLVSGEWDLPFAASSCSPVSAQRLVCSVPDIKSDIWIVENFKLPPR